jgi:hypothetical protein
VVPSDLAVPLLVELPSGPAVPLPVKLPLPFGPAVLLVVLLSGAVLPTDVVVVDVVVVVGFGVEVVEVVVDVEVVVVVVVVVVVLVVAAVGVPPTTVNDALPTANFCVLPPAAPLSVTTRASSVPLAVAGTVYSQLSDVVEANGAE